VSRWVVTTVKVCGVQGNKFLALQEIINLLVDDVLVPNDFVFV
jgi:hypothetical protein